MKKVLSLVLVLSMILSSMSFAFAGTSFEDVADTDYAEAIETLVALGVVTGYEDGTYRPERTVTRAEMAKLMVELLGYGDLVAGSKSNFADTQGHWGDSWIGLAAGRGIAIGDPSGNFRPDDTVTYDEVLTMLVRGLGYTDDCNELKGMTWPTNFKVKAAELNITKNVSINSTGADRGGVAQAMFNALDQQLVKVNSDGDIVKEFTTKGTRTDIPVNLISRIAIPNYAFEVGFEHINPEDKNYAGDKVDLSGYLFQTVEAYFNKNNDDEVVYVGDVESLTYKDTFEDETFDDGDLETLEVGDYVFDVSSALVSYNNAEAKIGDFEPGDLEDAKITVVLAADETRIKDDAEAAGIIVEKASAYVQIEEEYEDDATEIDEIYLPVKDKKVDSKNLIIKGDATELSEIEVDDIVAAYAPFDNEDPTIEDPDKLTLVVSRDTLDGKVTGTDGSDYLIDRVKYEVNDALNMDDLDIGDEGTFFLDDDGRIIEFVGESDGSKTYAMVYDDIIPGEYRVTSRGVQITTAPRVKLSTAADERITYDFDIELEKNDDGTVEVVDEFEGLFDVTVPVDGEGKINYNGADVYEELVSYTLNKDAEITKFAAAGRPIDMKTNHASFELASNVVIFDAKGNVIDEDDLGSSVEGMAVYRNGKIVALLATNIDEDVIQYFAYITDIDKDSDDDGDEIQRLTAYIKGSKNEKLYTNDEDIVNSGTDKLYVLDLNDNGEVKDASTVSLSATVTASAIDAKAGRLVIGGSTYYFDEGAATIIRFDEDGDVEIVNKLSAIEEEETEFKYVVNEDEDGDPTNIIGYIVIQ
ncbi:S-layer homology domain-containing protein [Sedimentibacter sp. MB31-C6]|uniref:S-layer homology domain-containing protein n=1 Tax=Sedimentibacter sp. MB31-C6 TaxID=3109366 RepID=UPI002DDD70C2|nr:S-layer homology domain-containing protein [Sedimentibacter sp. MB36-C1]WSI05398.1 S-layer homology domain-containing protein [Sedimentibacter sp. MB36-C1]